jgi:hypothetical protein
MSIFRPGVEILCDLSSMMDGFVLGAFFAIFLALIFDYFLKDI